ncbi:MAG TPA: hypothetical protein VNS88_02770 [Nitrospiraceae bacterium]|nr:hypothetical protein [Nitrospiraceae bacterium]
MCISIEVVVSHFLRRSALNDVTVAHDHDVVNSARKHAEIMRDQQERETHFLSQVAQQVEDFVLGCRIEGSGWFICNHQPGVTSDGLSNGNSLLLSYAKLMRISRRNARLVWKSHLR